MAGPGFTFTDLNLSGQRSPILKRADEKKTFSKNSPKTKPIFEKKKAKIFRDFDTFFAISHNLLHFLLYIFSSMYYNVSFNFFSEIMFSEKYLNVETGRFSHNFCFDAKSTQKTEKNVANCVLFRKKLRKL